MTIKAVIYVAEVFADAEVMRVILYSYLKNAGFHLRSKATMKTRYGEIFYTRSSDGADSSTIEFFYKHVALTEPEI